MHENLPLVSVVMPTYNQENLVAASIESVVMQDYANLELVISDDGSTDGTQAVIEHYAGRYPERIKALLWAENVGITGNARRNRDACRGKYIAWTAGDDLMYPGKISRQVAYMERHSKCALCYHNLDVIDADSETVLRRFNDAETALSGGAEVIVKHGCFAGACSVMSRASEEPEWGFRDGVPFAADWLFWVDVLAKGGEIHFVDEVLGAYRRHSGNVTSTRARAVAIDHLKSCAYIAAAYPRYIPEVLYRLSVGTWRLIRS